MALFMRIKSGLRGKKHGHQDPPMEKKIYFGQKRWLPDDIGNNVQILSLSYNTNIFDVHDDVTDISKNLLQSLVVDTRYNNVHHNFKASLFKDSNQILYEIYIYIENSK
jgi:hypothetical protein